MFGKVLEKVVNQADSYEKSARWHETASKTAAPKGKTYKEATMTLPSETDYPLIGSWFTPIRSIATSAGVTARDFYENVKAKIYGEVMDMAEQLSVTPKVKTKLDVDRLRELNIWIKQFGWYET
jgi:hypothetical protein